MSVRELSNELGVSEGTAYKAVKDAEQRGLVLVKPKAGTVRIGAPKQESGHSFDAESLCRLLGLTVAAGKDLRKKIISRFIICDGSADAMKAQTAGAKPDECLCLCGDREDMQTEILSSGCNLLLTSGAQAGGRQIGMAERDGLIIFSSAQSAYSLTHLISVERADRGEGGAAASVEGWMQTPDYLYYNDIIADWQRFFTKSNLIKQYPIVNDELELYGGLDLWHAASAVPSQKLSSVMADSSKLPKVSVNDDLRDVAKRFIVNGETLAAVMDGEHLAGVLSTSDLLRYYMYTEPHSYEYAAESFLSKDNSVSNKETAVYRIRIPDSEMDNIGHIETDLVLSAAESHLRQAGSARHKLENGTFFSAKKISSTEGLMLVTRLQHPNPSSYVVEAEIYDEKSSYAKAILMVTEFDEEA